MEILFLCINSILITAEYKTYKTFFTPFVLLASAYTLIIFFNNFIGVYLGFYKIQYISILYILYFLFLVYLTSIFSLLIFNNTLSRKNKYYYSLNIYLNKINKNKNKIICLFVICLLAKYISLIQTIGIYGLINIKGKARGIFAHLGSVAVIMAPYIMVLYIKKRKMLYFVFIFLLYISLIITGGKYGIIINFVHLIFLYALIIKNSLKKLMQIGFLLIIFALLIFIVVYAVLPGIISHEFTIAYFKNSILFAVIHFIFYLVSPVIATNFYFQNIGNGNFETLFTVPINIYKFIFQQGNYIIPLNYGFIPVHTYYSTNVGGLFAESAFNSSILEASFYVTVFFLLVYYFYNKSINKGKMISFTALLLSVSMMMFFSNFLTVSGVVIPILFLFIIEFFVGGKITYK